MSGTLYRKYRPQNWESVVGQETVTTTLRNAASRNTLAHAYLFSGPRGVGKTTIARLLAKTINCQNRATGKDEPCGTCLNCEEISNGRSIDVVEIDAASHTGVDHVREYIIENAQFRPTRLPYKVFIIDEVHMLSTSAFNALLKTLEEPPVYVVFVLATTELHKIPATIISRCQHFPFRRLPMDQIVHRLGDIGQKEGTQVSEEVLERVAYISEGCLRDAESLFGQILSIGGKKITAKEVDMVLPQTNFTAVTDILSALFKKDVSRALLLVDTYRDSGVHIEYLFGEIIDVLRNLLVAQVRTDQQTVSWYTKEQKAILTSLLSSVSTVQLLSIIEDALQKRAMMKGSPIPQLPLEMWIVKNAGDFILPEDTKIEGSIQVSEKKVLEETTDTIQKQSVEPTLKKKHTVVHPLRANIDEVRNKWKNFIEKIQQTNASLPLILNTAVPVRIEEEVLHIGVQYPFHQEKLLEPKTRCTVEKCLTEVLGEEVHIHCSVLSRPKEEENHDTDVRSVLDVFGGQVIEG